MKWSETTTFSFVEEYLKHDCLYNSKCIAYRDISARDSAILKICEVMNIPDFGAKEARSKIKNIRSTYSQELKKINDSVKSEAGTEEVYVPTLKWFKIYNGAIKCKNIRLTDCHITLNSKEVPCTADTGSLNSASQDAPITRVTKSVSQPTKSRKRIFIRLDNLENKIKAVGETGQPPTLHNEFDVFGKSVAVQMNAMPLVLALQAQSHIQHYLTTVRMKSLIDPLNIQDHPPSPPASTTYISSPSPVMTNSDAE